MLWGMADIVAKKFCERRSIAEIVNETGKKKAVVEKALAERGWKCLSTDSFQASVFGMSVGEAREFFASRSLLEIAAHFGVSSNTVEYYKKKYGFETRKR